MAVIVTHATPTAKPNDPTKDVSANAWNEAHTVTGLENVDNTSDANKPVSTAQAAADSLRVLKAGDTMTGDLVGMDFVRTRNGTITRSGGFISQVALTGGRTLTVSRGGNNLISSISDGSRTYTYTRDGSNVITSWTVT